MIMIFDRTYNQPRPSRLITTAERIRMMLNLPTHLLTLTINTLQIISDQSFQSLTCTGTVNQTRTTRRQKHK